MRLISSYSLCYWNDNIIWLSVVAWQNFDAVLIKKTPKISDFWYFFYQDCIKILLSYYTQSDNIIISVTQKI